MKWRNSQWKKSRIEVENSDKSPPMTSPLVNKLGYNGMIAWWDDILWGVYIGEATGDVNTINLLKHLKPVTGALPDSATPITLEDYITEVNHLRESTSSGPYIISKFHVINIVQ